ncbi:MAG: 50S ribosomal protein L25 [Spirochaetes bacterium]|nr:50S ribosomal protein L25 [Spirochaetota bacterium]MCK5267989.1 50S ribosomal protein L25 [Spirochaetota bacterium]
MEKLSLAVEHRTETGKCVNKRLRKTGKIPAVIYGKSGTRPISVDKLEFDKKFKHVSENVFIDLQISDGTNQQAVIKDYQKSILSGNLVHIDFYEIVKGKKLHLNIPVRLTGIPVGVRVGGGLLENFLHDVQVECLPKDIPEEITVDVTDLEIHKSIHIRDIDFPEGVTCLTSADSSIASVAGKKMEEEIEEEDEEEVEEEEKPSE